jgi:hypothetical protein
MFTMHELTYLLWLALYLLCNHNYFLFNLNYIRDDYYYRNEAFKFTANELYPSIRKD